ncbi:hypothetical protein SLOPH_1207, partial [Spraguea lophii 42_110]
RIRKLFICLFFLSNKIFLSIKEIFLFFIDKNIIFSVLMNKDGMKQKTAKKEDKVASLMKKLSEMDENDSNIENISVVMEDKDDDVKSNNNGVNVETNDKIIKIVKGDINNEQKRVKNADDWKTEYNFKQLDHQKSDDSFKSIEEEKFIEVMTEVQDKVNATEIEDSGSKDDGGNEEKMTETEYDNMVNFDEKKSKDPNFVKYSSLTKEEKYKLSIYSIMTLRKLCNKGLIERVMEYIRGLFSKDNEKFHMDVNVNPFIFELIKYLKEKGAQEGIFRISGSKAVYEQMPKGIQNGVNYNLNDYVAKDLASVLKAYIRVVLNGLIPIGASDALYSIYTENLSSKNILASMVLPFIFTEDKRKLLLAVRDLYEHIAENVKITRMTMNSLITASAPTFLPDVPNTTMTIAFTQKHIVDEIFQLDFENVPREIFEESKKLTDKCIEGRK